MDTENKYTLSLHANLPNEDKSVDLYEVKIYIPRKQAPNNPLTAKTIDNLSEFFHHGIKSYSSSFAQSGSIKNCRNQNDGKKVIIN